jgi:hypothetical protein
MKILMKIKNTLKLMKKQLKYNFLIINLKKLELIVIYLFKYNIILYDKFNNYFLRFLN